MKIVVAVLLLANLALAGYVYFASRRPNPDAHIIDQQLNAEKIRVIAPRPFVTPRAKTACLEWGTFSSAEVKIAQSALEPLNLGSRVLAREVQVLVGYWVYMPPFKSKLEIDRKVAELSRMGIRDYYVVESSGSMNNAISLGIFKTEEAARHYLSILQDKGVRSARVGARDYRVTQTMFIVRDPDIALTARMGELRARFPGSELKATECPGG